MSDKQLSPFLKRVEQTLETNVQSIQGALKTKAVAIVIVHPDLTIQNSASVTPGTEVRMCAALRALADRIEKGDGVKLVMPEKFKN